MQELPEHIQNAFKRENGFYTAYAIVKNNSKRRETVMEDNLRELQRLQPSRSGFFALYDKELEYIEFSTDKGYGHNLLINGEDAAISFEDFSKYRYDLILIKTKSKEKNEKKNIGTGYSSNIVNRSFCSK